MKIFEDLVTPAGIDIHEEAGRKGDNWTLAPARLGSQQAMQFIKEQLLGDDKVHMSDGVDGRSVGCEARSRSFEA